MTKIFCTTRVSLDWLLSKLGNLPPEMTSEYNGKKYVSISFNTLRNPDDFGYTHYLSFSPPTKEARASGMKSISFFSMKEYEKDGQGNAHQQTAERSEGYSQPTASAPKTDDFNDLPF